MRNSAYTWLVAERMEDNTDLDEAFHDAVDWVSISETRKEEVKRRNEKIKRLEKLLDRRDDRIEKLRKDLKCFQDKSERLGDECNKLRKRIMWFEEREKKKRDEERLEKAKKQREERIREEVVMRIRFEQDERKKMKEGKLFSFGGGT